MIIPLVGFGLFTASIVALIALAIDWAIRGVHFRIWDDCCFDGHALRVSLLSLGIVSIYIGQIYEEVKGRPNFIVRQTVGLDSPLAQAEVGMVDRKGTPDGNGPIADHDAGRLTSRSGKADALPEVSTSPGNVGDLVAGAPPDSHT